MFHRKFFKSLLAFTLVAFAYSLGLCDDSWLTNASEAEALSPPFTRTVYPGEVFNLKLSEGKALEVGFDGGERGGIILAIPIRDGIRGGDKEVVESGKSVRFNYTPGEVDSIGIKVFTGSGTFVGDAISMEERIINADEKISVPVEPFKEFTARFVNLSDYRTVFSYEFFSGDQAVSKERLRSRTITLDFKNDSKEKTWKSAADRVEINVIKGSLLMKSGQSGTKK